MREGANKRRSWSIDVVGEGRLHWRAERRRGGVAEGIQFGKLSAIVRDGIGEIKRLTGAGDFDWGAKLKSKKI